MQMMGITFELKVKEFYIHNLLFDGWTQGMLIEKFIMWWSSNISRGSASKREKREYCMPFNSNTDWCRLCHTNWSNYHAWFMNHVYFFRKLKVCHSTMLRKQDISQERLDAKPKWADIFFSTKKKLQIPNDDGSLSCVTFLHDFSRGLPMSFFSDTFFWFIFLSHFNFTTFWCIDCLMTYTTTNFCQSLLVAKLPEKYFYSSHLRYQSG